MYTLTDKLTQLTLADQRRWYLALAEVALQHYGLGSTTPTFIQHNAGIVFRVAAPRTGRAYLLKLHARTGAGANPSAEQLEAGLRWLADLAAATDVVVQVPVPTTTGQFVSQVVPEGLPAINCTLQQWVEGEPPHGHFTAHQVRQIGTLMAKLHAYSAQHPLPAGVPAMQHDAAELERNVGILRTALDPTVLPPKGAAVIRAAQERLAALMASLGTQPKVWGPVHGDLHHDNLLFYRDEVRPIDFTGLRLAHFAYDIAVTLYHIFYQGAAIRRTFLDGYHHTFPWPNAYLPYVEAFVAYAAIDNLAWNSTIAEQAGSQGFRRNLQQLIATFCMPLAEGRPFLFS